MAVRVHVPRAMYVHHLSEFTINILILIQGFYHMNNYEV